MYPLCVPIELRRRGPDQSIDRRAPIMVSTATRCATNFYVKMPVTQ